jgi:hypothetical protein
MLRKTFAVVIMLALLAAGVGSVLRPAIASTKTGEGQDCRVWNLTADMLTMSGPQPKEAESAQAFTRIPCNSPRVWRFLQSSTLERDPNTYSPLSRYLPNVFGIAGLKVWDGSYVGPRVDPQPQANQPFIGINTTGQVQRPLTLVWPAYAVVAHPAPEQLLVVSWRSPISGFVQISGGVRDIDNQGGDGIAWFIDKGTTNLAAGKYFDGRAQNFLDGTGGDSLNMIPVNRGDVLYFAIHPKGIYYNDSTRLDITIIALPR